MLNVSQAIKDKFQSDVCRKELKITIGNTVLTNSAIYKDGFRLTEAVMDGAVEFVGCIASMLEFKISTLALAKGNSLWNWLRSMMSWICSSEPAAVPWAKFPLWLCCWAACT